MVNEKEINKSDFYPCVECTPGHDKKGCTCHLLEAYNKEYPKMIPTMRVNYFDGSYYTVRKDKPGWEDIIEKINKQKGAKFLLEISREEQLSIIQNVPLVKVTEVDMTEADYMKINQ